MTNKYPPDIIYLTPEDYFNFMWCGDLDPGVDMEEEGAIKYIRADKVTEDKLDNGKEE